MKPHRDGPQAPLAAVGRDGPCTTATPSHSMGRRLQVRSVTPTPRLSRGLPVPANQGRATCQVATGAPGDQQALETLTAPALMALMCLCWPGAAAWRRDERARS